MKENREEKWFFLDTNIFLRIFIKENEKTFRDCLKLLNLVSRGKITAFTSIIVLIEINFVLISFYKFRKEKVVEAIKSIVELPHLKIIDEFNLRYALELYLKNKVKFIDCLITSSTLIMKNRACVVSYDRDFDKLEVKRLKPGDF